MAGEIIIWYMIAAGAFAISTLYTVYWEILRNATDALDLIDIHCPKSVLATIHESISWLLTVFVLFPVAFIAVIFSNEKLINSLSEREIKRRLHIYYSRGRE